VGLERGPLSLASTIEELLERKSSGSGLQNRDYGRRESAALATRYPSIRKSWQATSGSRSVSTDQLRTKATELLLLLLLLLSLYSYEREEQNYEKK
jgi:hypothetical protein